MSTAVVERKTNEAAISPAGRKSWWRACWETVGAIVFSIALLELSFAAAGIGEQEYLRPDPVTGFEATPNKAITWRKEGFARVRYNSYGYQDKEWTRSKPANVVRVAMLGDSYVEALQVDRSLNMSAQLEQRLNKNDSGGKRYEVMNFGVSANNIGQMYLRLKNYIMPLHPDMVILPFRVDSTFQLIPNAKGGFLAARPTFYIDRDGSLRIDRSIEAQWSHSAEAKRMRLTGWLRANSHIWGVLSLIAEQSVGWLDSVKQTGFHWGAEVTTKQTAFASSDQNEQGVPDGNAGAAADFRVPRSENDINTTRWAWPLSDLVLKAIKSECDAHQCKLVIVRLPAVRHMYNDVETGLLRQTCARYGITFFDACPAFEAQLARSQEPLFFYTHFTPLGHQLFSDVLFKGLLSANVLR